MLGRFLAELIKRPRRPAQPDEPAEKMSAHQLEAARAARASGQQEYAIMHLRRAYELAPEGPALRELVAALVEHDLCEKALEVALAARKRNPASYDALLASGLAYQKVDDPASALACYEQAVRLRSDDPELFDRRGSAYQDLGAISEALQDFDRALALHPDFAAARFHRAQVRLLLGDFAGGWDDYELRRIEHPHSSVAPVWDGRPITGATLLIRREQGLGDELMLASLMPEVMARAGRVVLECDARLRPLLERSFPGLTTFATIPGGGVPHPVVREGIDFEIPAGTLPRFLRRSLEQFPTHHGYLRAEPGRVTQWRERLRGLGPGLKVGLAWTGGVRRTRRSLRSLSLQDLLPILRTPRTRFISLQYTHAASAEVASLRTSHGLGVTHWPEAIDDYEETAALVSALDLVISVCTAVVHLGGGLGRPVWVLTPVRAEWRYGAQGDTMPWYPSIRLYRQTAFAQWAPVVGSVAEALARTTIQNP